MQWTNKISLASGALIMAYPAAAQDFVLPDFAQPAAAVVNGGDVAWVIAASLAGLVSVIGAMRFYAGEDIAVRRSFPLVLAGTVLLWVIAGYSLAFGPGSGVIGNASRLFLYSLSEVATDTSVSESTAALFELALAALAATLVGIALAAGNRHPRPVLFALLWLLFCYVPLGHWLRGGGWLAGLNVLDYAGGLAVHLSAGVAALIIARSALPSPEAVTDRSGGAAALLFGIVALCGGAAYSASDLTATALLNAMATLAAAVLAWNAIERLRGRDGGTESLVSAALVAAAAAAATAGFVGIVGALIIGAASAVAAYVVRRALAGRDMTGIGASIFTLHATGAATGALLVGILAFPQLGGPGFDSPVTVPSQLAAQAIGIVVTALWSAAVTFALLWLLGLKRFGKRSG